MVIVGKIGKQKGEKFLLLGQKVLFFWWFWSNNKWFFFFFFSGEGYSKKLVSEKKEEKTKTNTKFVYFLKSWNYCWWLPVGMKNEEYFGKLFAFWNFLFEAKNWKKETYFFTAFSFRNFFHIKFAFNYLSTVCDE